GLQLKIDTLTDFRSDFLVPFFRSFIGNVPQIGIFAPVATILFVLLHLKFLGNTKFGKQDFAGQVERFNLVHHLLDVQDGFRDVLEELLHFIRRLEVVLLVGKPITITTSPSDRCGTFFTIFYAEQDIMGLCIFFITIIGVVGGHQFNIMVLGHLHQYLVHTILIFLSVAHDLYVKVVPELLFPPQQGFFCLFLAHVQDFVGDFPVEISSEGDDILFVLLHNLFVNPWNIIEAIGVGNGGHFGQIVVPLLVLGQ